MCLHASARHRGWPGNSGQDEKPSDRRTNPAPCRVNMSTAALANPSHRLGRRPLRGRTHSACAGCAPRGCGARQQGRRRSHAEWIPGETDPARSFAELATRPATSGILTQQTGRGREITQGPVLSFTPPPSGDRGVRGAAGGGRPGRRSARQRHGDGGRHPCWQEWIAREAVAGSDAPRASVRAPVSARDRRLTDRR